MATRKKAAQAKELQEVWYLWEDDRGEWQLETCRESLESEIAAWMENTGCEAPAVVWFHPQRAHVSSEVKVEVTVG